MKLNKYYKTRKVLVVIWLVCLTVVSFLYAFSTLGGIYGYPREESVHIPVYHESAKWALRDLSKWIHQHKIRLPLFQNRLDRPQFPHPKVCVAISTRIRNNGSFSYIFQSVSALLNRMNYYKSRNHVYVHVFNTDSRVDSHPELTVVAQFLPVTFVRIRMMDIEIPEEYQEPLDTAQIYRMVHSMQCLYPIFVDDYALAESNWVDSVLSTIKQIELDTKNRTKTAHRSWLLVKSKCDSQTSRTKLCSRETDGVTDAVASLINREHLIPLADFLESTVITAIEKNDSRLSIKTTQLVEEFSKVNDLRSFCFERLIFQHPGFYTTTIGPLSGSTSLLRGNVDGECFDHSFPPMSFNQTFWNRLHR
jgi:hypothetical protein